MGAILLPCQRAKLCLLPGAHRAQLVFSSIKKNKSISLYQLGATPFPQSSEKWLQPLSAAIS